MGTIAQIAKHNTKKNPTHIMTRAWGKGVFGGLLVNSGHSKKGECSSNVLWPPYTKEQFFTTFIAIQYF